MNVWEKNIFKTLLQTFRRTMWESFSWRLYCPWDNVIGQGPHTAMSAMEVHRETLSKTGRQVFPDIVPTVSQPLIQPSRSPLANGEVPPKAQRASWSCSALSSPNESVRKQVQKLKYNLGNIKWVFKTCKYLYKVS